MGDGPVIFEQWCWAMILNGAKTVFELKNLSHKFMHALICCYYHVAFLLTHLCHHGWIVIIKEIKRTVLIFSFTQSSTQPDANRIVWKNSKVVIVS